MKSPGRVENAQKATRNAQGQFVKVGKTDKNPVENFIKETVTLTKSQDDLLAVRVGNPLKRITQLLEQIKRQKAFSFTLKGSLGIMGVALTLGLFGVFGGEKLLCSKGVQSKIGVVKILQAEDLEASNVFFFGGIIDWMKAVTGQGVTHPRVILIDSDGDTVAIPFAQSVPAEMYVGQVVVATGEYDSCTQTLKVSNASSLEPYSMDTPPL